MGISGYGECFESKAFIGIDHFNVEIAPITSDYLKKLGMGSDEMIELHKAVWDLAFPLSRPRGRKKNPHRDARHIKDELEYKYGLNDYNKQLEGEPKHVNYSECVDGVVEKIGSSGRIVICGGLASGKTVLAKRIRRIARRKGYDLKIFDEYLYLPGRVDGPTIQCVPYFPKDGECDLRVFVSVPYWRQTWNALKRLPTFQETPGLFTQNLKLSQHYELDFQKSISDIVMRYTIGRSILLDHLERATRNDPFDYI